MNNSELLALLNQLQNNQNAYAMTPGTTAVATPSTPAMVPDQGSYFSSLIDDMNLGDWMTGITGLGSLGLGIAQYGLASSIMNDQMDIAKERWGYTRDELERLKNVRKNVNQSYFGTTPANGGV